MPPVAPKPASPAASRAVVVGLEKYRVGELRGPVAEALLVASALHAKGAGVKKERIDLWLAPADDATKEAADAAHPGWRLFDIGAFKDFLRRDLAADANGGTLYLHWCGHGVARGKEHHLLLPRSSAEQLESLELDQLARLLVDGHHAAFGHVVLVMDTCRESLQAWNTDTLEVQPLVAQGRSNGPVYCKLFVCAEGQTTTYTRAGSSQGVLLRRLIAEAPAGQWPDFKPALQQAAARLAAASYVHATDWNDETLLQGRESSLDEVFGSAKVTFERQAELAALSLRPEMPRGVLADPPRLLAFLQDLPAAQGVAPLHEFALRLLAEPDVGAAMKLRRWVQDVISDAEQASIGERMRAAAPQSALLIWVAVDPDASPAQPAWRVMAARCNATGEPLPDGRDHHQQWHAAGLPALKVLLAGLLRELKASSKEPVELFLPRSLLAEGLELQELACGGEEEAAFDLAGTYITMLRNPREIADQRRLWKERAADLLPRWRTAQPLAKPPALSAARPADDFLKADGPLWCLVPDARADAALRQTHLLCTKHGLPALAWARGAADAQALQERLDAGLRGASAEAPELLRQLRLGGLHDLSLMLDDPTRWPPWGPQTT